MKTKTKTKENTFSVDEVKSMIFSSEEKVEYEKGLSRRFAQLRREYFAELGRDIQRARLAKKFTQEVLAQKIGTTKSNISRVERGHQNVTIGYLTKVANALGKTVRIEIK